MCVIYLVQRKFSHPHPFPCSLNPVGSLLTAPNFETYSALCGRRRRYPRPLRMAATPQHATVGVVSCRDGVCPGYTLLSVSRTTYLIDREGRVLHTWASMREVFVAYLLPSGNLLRDGGDLELAPQFTAGGASGYLEEVTWHNELVWSWSALPRFAYLSHHDVTPLPNGNVLVLMWERKNKEQALAAGRHPELLPDGEVWDNLVVELRPDRARGRASEVRRWSQWEHLVQDFDPTKANYVEDVAAHPTKFDLNYAPPGGKAACRSGGLQPCNQTYRAMQPCMRTSL